MKLGQASGWAIEVITYAEENMNLLSEWQQGFINSYGQKVRDFEEDCYVSDKQLEQLDKIAEALGVDQCDRSELDD